MWIHLVTQKLIKGASSTNTTLTTQDLENLADRVWDHMITNSWQARQLMQFLPNLLSLLSKNASNNTTIIECLTDLKLQVKPLRGVIQDVEKNILRGRGKNA